MPTEDEWEQAVQRMIELTESRHLNWRVLSQAKNQRKDVEGDVYAALVRGRCIAVYEYRFSFFDEDIGNDDIRNEVAIEFIEESGGLQYRWPAVAGRRQLLDAIRCIVAGAEEFIRSFLSETAG
jgi:hypothetical protein